MIHVSGKINHRVEVPVDISEEDLIELAMAAEPVRRALAGRHVRQVVARPPRLVNVVPAPAP